jgi:hypothetical protein
VNEINDSILHFLKKRRWEKDLAKYINNLKGCLLGVIIADIRKRTAIPDGRENSTRHDFNK